MTDATADHQLFDLGDFLLESGVCLPGARLAFQVYGTPTPERDNVILLPGAFNASIADTARGIARGAALDPAKYFVVVTGLFGNGQSSSPSNTPAPFDGPRFPQVTIADNVEAQARLLTERFGIDRLRLVAGFSMGALQAFHWAAHHPGMVERIAPICGAARCGPQNYVFLASLKAALMADGAFAGGEYKVPPLAGLAAFGRVDAAWLFSHAFFREVLDLKAMAHASIEDYLAQVWDTRYAASDANDLLSMIWSWQHADIAAGARYDGDFARALAAIKARAVVMPGATNLFFPVADSAAEVACMPHARLAPIPSVWGHLAGAFGSNPADTAFINARLEELLAR